MLKYTRYREIDFTLFVVEPETPFSEWMCAIETYGKGGETKYELYDTRKMTITPSEDDVKEIIMHHQNHGSARPDGSKTAIVISNLKEHWLVRIYNTLANVIDAHWQTHAFFTIEEARDWLGIEWPPSLDM